MLPSQDQDVAEGPPPGYYHFEPQSMEYDLVSWQCCTCSNQNKLRVSHATPAKMYHPANCKQCRHSVCHQCQFEKSFQAVPKEIYDQIKRVGPQRLCARELPSLPFVRGVQLATGLIQSRLGTGSQTS
ncbi:hypothetical protein BU16DRAFT_271315 [Lophium mytilinum]|uniref:Uncharacterized protein n=1 Tax=Lophium mytilinum TaxID=390894 RepID=A0A6A6R6U9_9PEZI|nr:hypothetical protein BU16DRAFT_271315 [Lophium mytilinum]